MNKQLGNRQMAEAVSDCQEATASRGKALECIDCKQCERVCPQHLKITDSFRQCVGTLEK